MTIDPRDPSNESLWLQAIEEVLAEMDAPILNEIKKLWREGRAKYPFNPLLKELRELIRRHDPKWDEGTELKPHRFYISIGGGPPRAV